MNLPSKENLWHQILKDTFKGQDNLIIIDATCGNGHDTLFLAQNFPKSQIHALDFDLVAIKNTKKNCNNYKNIIYHNMNYKYINKITKNVDIILYNTGYLPRSKIDLSLFSIEDLLISLKKSLSILKPTGIIVLMIYQGHDAGKSLEAVTNFCKNLNKYEYISFVYKTLNTSLAPSLILIERKNNYGNN